MSETPDRSGVEVEQDGVIKFSFDLREGPSPPQKAVARLENVRSELFSKNLIGVDPEGIGFGNLSLLAGRKEGRSIFYVTGSQTGHLPRLSQEQYVTVTGYDFDRFHVEAEGRCSPSSECLTHAALYDSSEEIGAVIHVHSKSMWDSMIRSSLPATENIEYGTAEMVREVQRMHRSDAFRSCRGFAMLGHEPGVIAFGENLDDALQTLMGLYRL